VGWRRAELAFLVVFLVALPIFEAPKNIFWFLYLIAWVGGRVRSGRLGGPWRAWDSMIAALLAAAAIGAAFAGLHGGEWSGARDVGRYGLMLWAFSRTDYDEREWRWLHAALIAGTIAAVVDGVLRGPYGRDPELNLRSVGHPNHSATYLTVLFGAVMSWLLAYWKSMRGRGRALWAFAALFAFAAVVATGSRVAVVVAAVYGLILGLWFARRSWKPLLAIFASLGVAVGVIVLAQPWVLQKQLRNMGDDNVLAFRGLIWERALTAWREYPAFGVGQDNFARIDSATYQAWSEKQGKAYSKARDYAAPHAHSLYLNALAERGLFGFAVLLVFLATWLAAQMRSHPAERDDLAWALWGSSLGAWFAIVAIGLVNTSLHTEPALISVLFLGGWLSYRGRQGPS
jgi:O-antigen ligase